MKILLVDDEEDILTLVSATLEDDKRYQVILARNGDEALALASRQNPELMFLDIRMPGKNGWEVCKALKEGPTTARIKVVMLTALIQESDRQRAIEAGADGYLTKPFSPLALLNKAEEVLRGREL